MNRTAVLNVVGLTPKLLGDWTPELSRWAKDAAVSKIKPAFPAVTCTAQVNYLTGRYPETHGVVGNGWYSAEDCEIRFWKQSSKLVRAPKVWDAARALDPSFTCANLFWWYNMYSSADYSVTPRPMYPADGRKIPDVYTKPVNLRDELQSALGTFPLFEFWGPRASIRSTEWIAAAAKHVEQKLHPTLTLVYLPHLDYNLQRLGSADAAIEKDVRDVDRVCGDLIRHFESQGVQVLVVSEYGLCDVSKPVHINRLLRQNGFVAFREELGLEVFDPGASAAFAGADHQVAHGYVNGKQAMGKVREVLEAEDGVELVLDRDGQRERRLNHERTGDLVAVAAPDAWFTYYYWLDDQRAPDYARTVDIHRKPGYDPVELFLDPAIMVPAAAVGWRLLKRACRFRTLLDVIPLDATLVKGSHGRPGDANDAGPLLITRQKHLVAREYLDSVEVHDVMLNHLTGAPNVDGEL